MVHSLTDCISALTQCLQGTACRSHVGPTELQRSQLNTTTFRDEFKALWKCRLRSDSVMQLADCAPSVICLWMQMSSTRRQTNLQGTAIRAPLQSASRKHSKFLRENPHAPENAINCQHKADRTNRSAHFESAGPMRERKRWRCGHLQ